MGRWWHSMMVGERLLDRHDFEVTGAGNGRLINGRLFIGMYRADTLERLPFANGETALELAPIIIND